jgi:hypothetical protein
MLRLRLKTALVLSALALLSPAAASAGSSMFIGAVDNAPLEGDLALAKAKLDLARLAGFGAIRVNEYWTPEDGADVRPGVLEKLKNATAAAAIDGLRVVVSVSNPDSRSTPRTPQQQQDFAAFCSALATALPGITDFIVGNEPNLNMFWLPQFSKPVYGTKRVHGKRVRYVKKQPRDLAAPAYESLLALTYDALKAVNPDVNVIGVALSPRGGDVWKSKRQTHSPQTFIADLGSAYRASGRTTPLMDAFAIHPYPEKSSLPPTLTHPRSKNIGLADYGKLVASLGKAFDGTAQAGSTLPIVYDEFGVQTKIPAAKTSAYTNLDTKKAQDAVSETTQAAYYRQALQMAYCQPNVVGIMIFHLSDERDGTAWQSGLYYADDTPKSSLAPVRATIESAADGTLAHCSAPVELREVLAPPVTTYPADNTTWRLALTCEKWCTFVARIESLKTGIPALVARGDAAPGAATAVAFPDKLLAPGTYRYTIRVFAFGRVGTTVLRIGPPFAVAEPTAVPPPVLPGLVLPSVPLLPPPLIAQKS